MAYNCQSFLCNSTKTHGPRQHQQHKNTWTPSASTAQKHMDPISINSTKTHGPHQHQQHKNTRTLSASTGQKQKHIPPNVNYTRDDTKLKPTDDKTKDLLIKSNRTIFLDKRPTSLHVGTADIPPTTCPCNHSFTISGNIYMTQQAHFNSTFSRKADESAPSSSACLLSNQNSLLCLCSLQVRLVSFSSTLLPLCLLSRLQKVQNSAVTLVFKAHKCSHVQPLLQTLHWLLV